MSSRVVQLGRGQIVYQAEIYDESFELKFYEHLHSSPLGSMGEPGDRSFLDGPKPPAVVVTGPIASIGYMIETLREAQAIHAERMKEKSK